MQPVALFWDQSLLWGLLLYDALCEMDIPFCLIRSADVRRGILSRFPILLVPGGWASQKVTLLGEAGRDRILEFVSTGGTYIGFCGGVGLVLSGKRTLNIIPLRRLPLERRIPSASGPVMVRKKADHPLWDGLPEIMTVSIWWPSQVEGDDLPDLTSLAVYDKIAPGFWVSDIPFDDIDPLDLNSLEDMYGINLNPEKYLYGRPAIMEYPLEKGTFLLSYPHLETPGDVDGRRFFRRMIEYGYSRCMEQKAYADSRALKASFELPLPHHPGPEILSKIRTIRRQLEDLIEFGRRNLLWFWRKPWLLGWKRGIRGLEYSMMFTLVRFLECACEVLSRSRYQTCKNSPEWSDIVDPLTVKVSRFLQKARELLIRERFLSQTRMLPKLGSVDPCVDGLRSYLFGSKMNHGGLSREIFDLIDEALYKAVSLLVYYNVKIRFTSRANDFTIVDA